MTSSIPIDLPRFNPTAPIANIGMGVMGTKVAWACARAGLPTRVFDVDSDKAVRSRELALTWSEGDERDRVAGSMHVASTLDEAVDGAQLAFENVPENLALKQTVLAEIGGLLPATGYMGTNASSLTSTPLAEASRRPDRFFNLNFTDPRVSRLVELMTGPAAAPETVSFGKAWARAIGMVPMHVRKEQLGYSFNRLWRVIKKEVLRQVDQGYTTADDIDRAWMLTFGTSMGPCAIMDDIGLNTVLSVEKVYHAASGDESDRPPRALIDLVDRNELGVATGKGFYAYPDPAFERPDFLDGRDD